MSELGTRLKEARIAKGYSLEDLQGVTKIQKRYLAGIEEGDYSMMPGPFYVRAFIKQYAEAVGLNSDELLEQHKSEVPEKVKEDVRPPMAPPTPSRRQTFARSSSSGIGEVMPKIIVALFIVVIIGVVWFFYQFLATNNPTEEVAEDGGVQYEEPATSEEEEAPATEEEPAEEEAAPEEPEEEPEASLAEEGTQGETTTYVYTGPAERELQIEASGASWVSATDQNQKELMEPARTMQDGDSETIDLEGVTQVRVRIGATSNVTLTVNDEQVEYAQNAITQNIVIRFEDEE
ncbi:helix-turn-helix domain-containing protein [Planomicrobium sp. CPCC 101079]|uniref:helix-turn-helix domain-containing protein n=1 Tax=Planomicrobium sp. CPCC 101079 TaxID=2599618 RepID=UPI0011B48A80|nr:helix-turn-helix domain-containing protein [Planomicrobium sp. CPCC 101079]TWT04543.1 helix-turn-helix domain-containing protein [Planomicrobium sp. CPCC 101079]